MKYVTVMDAKPRSGWLVASRDGDTIVHRRLNAAKSNPDGARAEAETMFPDHLVVLPDDTDKPWKKEAA
jgi:hypothetical protein